MGLLVGTASAGFLKSLDWVTNFRENHHWLILFLPLAGLAIGLLYHYYGKNVDTGTNLLLNVVHNPQQNIPFKMAPFVFLGTMVTHFFGGSAGREGTALQMAGAICYPISGLLKLNANEKIILIIAAIAAGFGSVFGTPIAGAIFSLEVALIGRLKYDALFPAFLSAILANLVCQLWQVSHASYNVTSIPPITLLNVFYGIIAGIAFGLCAASFSKCMHWLSAFFKTKIKYPPLRPLIGGVIIAISVFAIGSTKFIGLGLPTIALAFEQQLPAYSFALKMIFTIITLSAGFKGGEVTPLFFIGAALGNALFYFIPLPISLLVAMGFVAVFAGASNTPLACTILAIELFGAQCGLYAALACVVSYLTSGNTGIYTNQRITYSKHKIFKLNRRTLLKNL